MTVYFCKIFSVADDRLTKAFLNMLDRNIIFEECVHMGI